jgi:LPXTG-motif cell wall-anchored protein
MAAYYRCEGCGKLFSDASGEHEITGSAILTDGTGEAKNYAVKIIPGKLTVTRITYTIKYNANGGQYVGSEVNHGDDWMLIKNGYTYNEAVTLHNGEGFQREGYKLVGWTTGSVNYELGEIVEENFTKVQNGTVQMYAIWELIETEEPSDQTGGVEDTDSTEPSEPDEEIEDEDVPLGSAPSDSTEAPKTGDNNVFMSMIIGALALIAMATLVLNKKKFFID